MMSLAASRRRARPEGPLAILEKLSQYFKEIDGLGEYTSWLIASSSIDKPRKVTL
jgi:hypothetical protein